MITIVEQRIMNELHEKNELLREAKEKIKELEEIIGKTKLSFEDHFKFSAEWKELDPVPKIAKLKESRDTLVTRGITEMFKHLVDLECVKDPVKPYAIAVRGEKYSSTNLYKLVVYTVGVNSCYSIGKELRDKELNIRAWTVANPGCSIPRKFL
jgi:hypothetical protein